MSGEFNREETRSPRALFAQRFADLYEAAGNPTLRRVAAAAEARMRAAQGNRPNGASAQRISDWKAGRNVPARFESLLPVVLALVEQARKSGRTLPRDLADPRAWQQLWHDATTWNPDDDSDAACPYLGLTSYRHENHNLFFGRARASTELTALVREASGLVAVVGASGAGKSSLLAAGLTPTLNDWDITTLTPGSHPELDPALAPRPDGPRRLLIIDQFEELFTTCDSETEREDFLTALEDCATRADDPIVVVIALRADFYAHCLNYPVLQDTLEHRSYLLGPMRLDELAQAITGPARATGLELEPGLEELVITELCGVGDHHKRRGYDPGALPLLSHVMAATWQQREGRKLTVLGYRKAGGVVGSVAETAEHAWNELSEPQQRAAKDILLGLVAVGQDSRDTRRPAQRLDLLRRAADPEDATAALELLSSTRLITLDADAVNLTHEIVLSAWPRLNGWIDEDRVGYLVRQRLEADAAEWADRERDSTLLYRGTRLQNALDNAEPPVVGDLAREFLTASKQARDHTHRRSTRTKVALAVLGVILLVLGFAAYAQGRLAEQQRDDKNFAAVMAEADRLASVDPSVAAQMYLIANRLRPDDDDVRTRLLRTQDLPLMTSTAGHDRGILQLAYRPGGDVLASVDDSGSLWLWDATDPQRPRQLGQRIDNVRQVAFSPDGRFMTTISYDSDPRLWDVSIPAEPRQVAGLSSSGGHRAVRTAFIGDGRTLAALSSRDLTLWNSSDPTAPVAGPAVPLYRAGPTKSTSVKGQLLAYNRGRLLAIADNFERAGIVQLWDVGNPEKATLVTEINATTSSIGRLEFSPDGTTLAISGFDNVAETGGIESTLRLWNVTDPARPRQVSSVMNPADSNVMGLAFSPDGQTLAISGDRGMTLWNVSQPAHPIRLPSSLSTSANTCRYRDSTASCDGGPIAVVFSPDGRRLVTGSFGGSLQVWSLQPSRLDGHAATVGSPAFDASGERMVTHSRDGKILIWDMRNPAAPKRIGEYQLPPGAYATDLTPDGRTLLIAEFYYEDTVLVLDLSNPAHIGPPTELQLPDDKFSITVSRDWRIMATSQKDTVQLWDLADLRHPVPRGPRIPVAPDFGSSVFDPDGDTLLIIAQGSGAEGEDFVVARWDISDPDQPRQLDDLLRNPSDGNRIAVFTKDFRTMVTLESGMLQSWDISAPERAVRYGGPVIASPTRVYSVDFTSDARTMITSGSDGMVQLWDYRDPAHPQRLGGSLTRGEQGVSVYFHPTGRFIVGTGATGDLRLWVLDERHAIDRICATTGTLWTPDLWRHYVPQLPFDPPCD